MSEVVYRYDPPELSVDHPAWLLTFASQVRLMSIEITKRSHSTRSRYLDYRRQLDVILAAPPSRWTEMGKALRALHPGLDYLPGAAGIEWGPYPKAHPTANARIVFGEKPTDVMPGLTRAEAHAALTAGPNCDVITWLMTRLGVDLDCRSIAVVRWVADVCRDPARKAAFTRRRVWAMPGGEVMETSYSEHTDMLLPEDLVKSVDETFRRVSERQKEELELLARTRTEPLRHAPSWWRPMPWARLLLSAADLAVEGKTMEHCVAGYAPAVQRGTSYIVALRVPHHVNGVTTWHRSTVEFSHDGERVVQHRARQNGEPHEVCRRALKRLYFRINGKPL